MNWSTDELVTHSGLRLYPSAGDGSGWLAIDLVSCVRFRCSQVATAVLIAFMDGGNVEAICAALANRYALDRSLLDETVAQLSQLRLLVPPDDTDHCRYSALFKAWAEYGWVDSADYHVATLNYPFADYSVDGREIDYQRMVQYVQTEPDLERAKYFADAPNRIPAPLAADVLQDLKEPFVDLWNGDPGLERLDRSRCLALLSVVFGKLRSRQLATNSRLMADAIGKTSPSGGSRHPTEAYLFAASIEGLNPGIYHYNVLDVSLDRIAEFEDSHDQMMKLFSGPLRASFAVDGVVVMTSVFERSMYRYREPRSFRAIYMDVGHICGTMDISAKALRVNCLVQHGLNDRKVGELLRLDPLVEGVIYGAAIGGSGNQRTRNSKVFVYEAD
ncbi:SagB/ThcOx family dehydrogenase [Falsirhodobacter xinxiangensis]|uniref:SagB/ThcOx family dehydrogenase n=1 Tax=Falsirhodobacter xinxiangensis TaxID=2530049 RepID=UPI0010AA19FC|nr:SagB/ThcOx family dehydrogenase [Rhodobacter xinxiangensis]